jgi:uncharacterized membrane protein HdeD (DUF308 family)
MTQQTTLESKDGVRGNPLDRIFEPVTDKWWIPLVTGVAWLVVSVLIFRFDFTTVAAVAALFGIVAIASSINEVVLAALSTTGWRIAHLLFAAVSFAVGIISFIHPGDTFVALAALVSFFLVFRGWFDIVQAFSLSRHLPGWWLLLITGIAELAIGFWGRVVEPLGGGSRRVGRCRCTDARSHGDRCRLPAPGTFNLTTGGHGSALGVTHPPCPVPTGQLVPGDAVAALRALIER